MEIGQIISIITNVILQTEGVILWSEFDHLVTNCRYDPLVIKNVIVYIDKMVAMMQEPEAHQIAQSLKFVQKMIFIF